MENKLSLFKELAKLFKDNNFSLYLVGGTVRDYLLNKEIDDMDLTTDATPSEMSSFLKEADFTFSKLGFIKLKYKGITFDITTLRKEGNYKDFRHPSNIEFVKDLKEDYIRRDFTINAMYMDENLNVIDYCEGRKDLENHILKMVGDPKIRIQEDPLRILRAIRFSLLYNLKMDPHLIEAINENVSLLEKLNIDKIKQEFKKMHDVDKNKLEDYLNYFSIQYILKVVD